MRLFVSVPTKGRSDKAVEAIKQTALERVQRTLDPSAALIDSYVAEDAPEEIYHDARAGLWYLGESMKRLATADAAFFADGWEQARGCRLERAACEAYDLPVILDTPTLDRYAARRADEQWRLNECGVSLGGG